MVRDFRSAVMAGLLMVTVLAAQAQWELGGQIRYRFESSNRDFHQDTKASNVNLLRSRLNVTLSAAENVTGFFQLQDSRTFGEETWTMDGDADQMDLHQGFIHFTDLLHAPIDLKVGRMEVIYGPERLIGAVGWSNVGRSFDGAVLKLRQQRFTTDLFYFKEKEVELPRDSLDTNVQGIYADLNLVNNHTTQAFLIRQQTIDRRNIYTTGLYVKGEIGPVAHEIEAAYQFGEQNPPHELSYSAYLVAINLSYSLSRLPLQPMLSAGIDYLSGDDDIMDNTSKVFYTMYATNHKYYGYMDYFITIAPSTLHLGLTDIHGKVSLQPLEHTKLHLAYHIFRASQSYGTGDKDFLQELDLTLNYSYTSNVSMVGGASLAWPGEIFKSRRGSDMATWLYLMTVVNF
ncbi:MAG: alginate export family protein [Fidelibacterota bacterium]|nr:MAG: alginate export family protein [Candidatus Neomarinimicrobiota bacterium]